ncbi:MAG: amylo-alpha-1,6-glucosidase [Microbacterium sp.]|uniref:glycogen debranching N-terminal domain-containing protein n=1 Tax=Microbacterium sp. TaxID=51671 RepID=UPI001AD021EA|nr:glycogen debranching N-terminal domain-containing protein [Microbacterium sp.]MBN9175801.1 amylo-alpha-1,6-glucosidase [Microbacterium sp.]
MRAGRQPFLDDRTIVLTAPTQAWSGGDGDMGSAPIDGVYHGDTRFIRALTVTYAGDDGEFERPEWTRTTAPTAAQARFDGLLRGVDDGSPDPKVRIERVRDVGIGRMSETLTVRSHLAEPVTVRLRAKVVIGFAPLQDVKAGAVSHDDALITATADGAVASREGATLSLHAPGAQVRVGDAVVLDWTLPIAPFGAAEASWTLDLDDQRLVVRGVEAPATWAAPAPVAGADARLDRWLHRALGDLAGLRLTLPDAPDDVFFAAGAPWFFTLFGRDSLWAARLMLPLDADVAASTLRVLARLQGAGTHPDTAEQPGKIMHELRAGTLALPGEGIVLPPLYYGTVDATPLWVCLLAETAPDMPDADVRALLPHLEAALGWILAAAGEDGFLDYVDETGHGLSNQGWKDSGDSIQWRDGALAEGPIALCEVQGYAYEAALGGAALLDRFGRPGGDEVRAWAAGLKRRFDERFWVTTPEGRYPAIALDRDGRAVDTLTSNIGHLLGTGILDEADEATVAALLVEAPMASGFGVRTLSTGAAGYWPLSYHGGSVWTHDTAIIARGMARAGRLDDATAVVSGMLAAAEAFDYRVPELHAGDAATAVSAPAPYPAACRPQAWSAAAAVTAWEVLSRAAR